MIIALSIAYDDGDFAVHYARAKSLAQAQRWCGSRKADLQRQGTACASAVFESDHVQWIDDCERDEPPAA